MSRFSWREQLTLSVGLALLALVLLLVNLIAARQPLRLDWTGSRVYSLSPKTERALRALTHPVEIKVFMVPPERQDESLYYETRELLRRFETVSRRLSVEYVDIDANPARATVLSKKYDVQPADLAEGLVVFACADRVQIVRGHELGEYEQQREGRRLRAFHGEALFLGALLEITNTEQVTVCFSAGHGEPSTTNYADDGYGQLWDEVRRDNYGVRLLQPGPLSDGAEGCGVVLLAGPRLAFSPEEVQGVDRYLTRHGRLLALLGPQLDRRVTRFRELGLETMLHRWGVALPSNVVVDPLVVPGEQPLLTWAAPTAKPIHPIGRAMSGRLTVWPLAREVRPLAGVRQGLSALPFIFSSAKGWAETDLASLRGERPLQLDAEDQAGPVSVAVAVSWRQSKIVVLGSERGVLNRRIAGQVIRDYDRDLVLVAIDWLAGRERMVAIGPKTPEHVRLVADERVIGRIFLLCVVGLPLFSLALALVVWWRRRR